MEELGHYLKIFRVSIIKQNLMICESQKNGKFFTILIENTV
jgi:hypothetical protein